jgi:multimeric flavodoxin WrbA
MAVRLLGLNCSPRDNSNSETLLRASLNRLTEKYSSEVECSIVNLREVHIEACRYCEVCGKSKRDGSFRPCVQAGKDGVQEVLDRMIAADGLVVATPVYRPISTPSSSCARVCCATRTSGSPIARSA